MNRKPPKDTDIEAAVLGALLNDRNAIETVADALRPEHFFDANYSTVYSGIKTLYDKGAKIDLLSVSNYLNTQGSLEPMGGAYFLTGLISKVASSAHLKYHTGILLNKWKLREIIRAGDKMVEQAYALSIDPDEIIDSVEDDFFSIRNGDATDDGMWISEAAEKLAKSTEKAYKAYMKGEEPDNILNSGFPHLNSIFTPYPDDLIVVAGRPAMGKTAFVLSLLRNYALFHKKPFPFFSLEVGPDQLAMRMAFMDDIMEGMKIREIRRGNMTPQEWDRFNQAMTWLEKLPMKIYTRGAITVSYLRSQCKKFIREHGAPPAIGIDYLQLMTGEKGGTRENEVGGISRALKALAKELQVPIFCLSQLSRDVEKRGGDKKPNASDLRASGSIEQDADTVMMLYRPEYYNLTTYEDGTSTQGIGEVLIVKQRNGPTGEVKLRFVKSQSMWKPLEYMDTLKAGFKDIHDPGDPRGLQNFPF